VYSDGLATVSVFVEKSGDASEHLEGFTSHGAVNTYSTQANGHQVTVIGEVPPITVRKIAASVAALNQ